MSSQRGDQPPEGILPKGNGNKSTEVNDTDTKEEESPVPALTGLPAIELPSNLGTTTGLPTRYNPEDHSVHFSATVADIRAAENYLILSSPTRSRLLFLAAFAMIFTPLALYLDMCHTPALHGRSLFFLAALPADIFLCLWTFYLFGPLLYRNMETEMPFVFLPRMVGIDPASVRANDFSGESNTPWVQVKRVDQTRTHIFFVMPDGTSFVVPKRAFPNTAEAESFYQTAKEYWQRSRG